MATYLILNLCFIGIAMLFFQRWVRQNIRTLLPIAIVLIILTAVFDNAIIYLDVVDYHTDKLLNLYIGKAPVEDFFYALLAVFLIPAVWHKLGVRDDN